MAVILFGQACPRQRYENGACTYRPMTGRTIQGIEKFSFSNEVICICQNQTRMHQYGKILCNGCWSHED